MLPGSKGDRRGTALAAGLLGLGLLGGASFGGASGALAADDGYANVFSSVLGSVGLIKDDPAPVIHYRERPPLVLPKDDELPKPAAVGSKRSAAWPQDPDVLKKRKDAAEARAPHTLDPGMSDHGYMLSHEEQMRGRTAAADAPDDQPVRSGECGNDNQHCLLLKPDEIKREEEAYRDQNPDKKEELVAGKEPEREFLTQPPKGYLKPTKALKATTEAPEEKADEASPRYMEQQAAKHRAEMDQ